MTEEEKKAIVFIKKDLEKSKNLDLQIVNTDRISIQTLLNLIEKQGKRISYLENDARKIIQEELDKAKIDLYKNYVSKEAIREKLNELEKYIYTGKNAPQDFLQYRVKAQIRILEEILGE